MRRPISATLKVVAVGFVLAVAGCAPVPTGIVYQPAAETSDEQARSELLAAFGAQYGVPISMEMVMGDVLTMTGSTDPTNGAAHMSMSIQDGMMRLNMEVIVIVPDMWMNMGEAGPMLGLETPWVHIDMTQYTQSLFPFMGTDLGSLMGFDPTLINESIIDVAKVDDVTFEGELDPLAMDAAMMGGEALDPSGPALTVPFTAVVDDQGRLVRMSFTIPGAPPGVPDTMEASFYDYGVPVEISPPPADEVGPMPEELLELFGAGG